MLLIVLILILLLLLHHMEHPVQTGGTAVDVILRYGDVVHFRLAMTEAYLDVCGATPSCPGNGILNVQAADVPDREGTGTGSWIIVKKERGGAMGQPIRYGDTVHVKNLWGMGSYLDVCGWNATCNSGNIQTHNSPVRSTEGSGTWKIMHPTDKDSTELVTNNSPFLLESMYANAGQHMVVCGVNNCSNTKFDVSLRDYTGTTLQTYGKWILQRLVKPGDEEAAISCCLGTNKEGCRGLGLSVCPHVLSFLGTSTPEAAEAIYNSGIYKKSSALQNKMDREIADKCKGEWADKAICDCFHVVDAANRIPGYNPICHNIRCASGLAYKTRQMEKIVCPGNNLTYCVQDLNLSDMDSAELSKIKLSNQCGHKPTPPPAMPTSTPSISLPTPTTTTPAPAPAQGHTSLWFYLMLVSTGIIVGLGILRYMK